MSYNDSVNNQVPVYTPIYPTYSTNQQVMNDSDSNTQSVFSNIQQEKSEIIKLSLQLASMQKLLEEKTITVKTESGSTPVLSGFLACAEEVAKRVKDYFLGDGLRLLGTMTAILTTAAIMRKYPHKFAIPTLEGNWGKSSGNDYYGHHNW